MLGDKHGRKLCWLCLSQFLRLCAMQSLTYFRDRQTFFVRAAPTPTMGMQCEPGKTVGSSGLSDTDGVVPLPTAVVGFCWCTHLCPTAASSVTWLPV